MATGTQLEKSAQAKPVQRPVQPQSPGAPQFLDQVGAFWSLLKIRWGGMSSGQRNWAIGAAVLLSALFAGLLWYGLSPNWRILYAGMDPEDARQIGQILTQAQIPYEPTVDGAGIRVPAAQLDKARLATAAKGGVKSGRLGFEIFDKPNWVGSEFDEQVNYQRALEGELEHTVATLADIESARVHLVMPHDSLFREQQRPAKASVVLKLRHRSLADGEAEAIRNLVSSAVDGLSPDSVVLVDAAGNLPLGPKTAAALQLTAEQALEQKLISTLEPVTGAGNVRASVTLEYDQAASDVTQQTYEPDKTVTLSMQRTEQTTGAQTVAAGVPGAASNAPNTQALPVYPQQTTAPATAKTESGTYGASRTDRHIVEGPGKVRRLTAAIVVNDRMAQPAVKGKAAVWQPRSADEMRNLTALAQASVGFDPSRGDMLTVEDLAFDQNRSAQPTPAIEKWVNTAERSPLLVKYFALFIGLLLVLALGVRPALRRAGAVPVDKGKTKAAAKAAASELPAGLPPVPTAVLKPPEPIESDPERIRTQEIFEQVTSHLKREPTQSSRLLQSWIHSD